MIQHLTIESGSFAFKKTRLFAAPPSRSPLRSRHHARGPRHSPQMAQIDWLYIPGNNGKTTSAVHGVTELRRSAVAHAYQYGFVRKRRR